MDLMEMALGIVGKSIELLPLGITYLAIQASLKGVQAINSFVTGASRKAQDASGKVAGGFRKRQEGRREIRGSRFSQLKYGRQAKKDAIAKGIETEAGRARASYVARLAESSEGFRNKLAGGSIGSAASTEAVQRALAGAINVQAKIEADEVSAASAVIKNANLNIDGLRKLSKGADALDADGKVKVPGGSTAVRRAAIQSLVQANDVAGINNLVDDSRAWGKNSDATPQQKADGDRLRRTLADSLGNSNARPAYLSRGVLANIENGTNEMDSKQLLDVAIENGTYAAAKNIADADKDELELLANALNNRPALTQAAANVRTVANEALTNPRLSTSMGKNRTQAERVAGLRP